MKTAVLIPCRNRERYLSVLLEELPRYMEEECGLNEVVFYIAEDTGTGPYNAGLARNVAALAALEDGGYGHFIFHDVDVIPVAGVSYRPLKQPVGWVLNAGTCMMEPQQFCAANGYDVGFFGWAPEDRDLLQRLAFVGHPAALAFREPGADRVVLVDLEWPGITAEEANRRSQGYFGPRSHRFIPGESYLGNRMPEPYNKFADFYSDQVAQRNGQRLEDIWRMSGQDLATLISTSGLNQVRLDRLGSRERSGSVRRIRYCAQDVLSEFCSEALAKTA
jgi:hypothetical protein